MKVLITSHAYVVALNQQKLEALASLKDIELSLVVPTEWKAVLRTTTLEKRSDPHYTIYPLPVFFNGNNDKFCYNSFELFNLIRKIQPDIIHIEEEPWSVSAHQFALMGKILGAKVVLFSWENMKRAHKPWYALSEKVVLSVLDGLFAGSQQVKNIIASKGFKKPIEVLPQIGVDSTTFAKKDVSELKKKLGLSEFTIGFLGRLDSQKGIEDLIQACQNLDFKYQLLIVGNGPLRDSIREQSKRNDHIILAENVTHSMVPEYLNLFDVFVLPSRTTPVWKEQFGHVLIEAMSCEVPVIGSDSGAIPEVMAEAGIIFKEGNTSDLAQAITRIYQDPNYATTLAKKGIERVKKEYTQEKIAEKTLEFYKKLFQSRLT